VVERDNLEIVQRTFDGWNEGDVDAFMAPYGPEVVLETPPNFPEGGTFTGAGEVRRFFETLRQGWEGGSSVSVAKLTPVGDDRVLAEFRWHGIGEASGVEAALETLALFTVGEGRIARAQFFFERDEALEAAGLES
jgi:ketosteroid isomerase-like protein